MMTAIDEAKLKELLKSAVAEVFEERRDFVKEIIEEERADIALAQAIDDGVITKAMSRDDVFRIMETTQ